MPRGFSRDLVVQGQKGGGKKGKKVTFLPIFGVILGILGVFGGGGVWGLRGGRKCVQQVVFFVLIIDDQHSLQQLLFFYLIILVGPGPGLLTGAKLLS